MLEHGQTRVDRRVAEVDVITRPFPWFKTVKTTRTIVKERHEMFWFFLDSGDWTPGIQAEKLDRVWWANNYE